MKDKRKTFWLYVALAYLITWIPWIPLERYAAQYGYVLPNPQTLPVLFENGLQDRTHLVLVLLSSAMILFSGPLIAAIIASAVESGRKGVSDLWRTSTRWKIGGRWYGIMLAILLFINLPALLIGLVRGPLSGSQPGVHGPDLGCSGVHLHLFCPRLGGAGLERLCTAQSPGTLQRQEIQCDRGDCLGDLALAGLSSRLQQRPELSRRIGS